jgi:anti-anti-sigma factor
MSADFQHLKIDRKGDAVVIILANVELYDRLMTDEVRQELITLIDAEKPLKVVISFEEVAHCSTEVINALIRARKRVLSYGGEFRLCLVRQEMRQVLRVLKLDGTIFDIHDTLNGALLSFS